MLTLNHNKALHCTSCSFISSFFVASPLQWCFMLTFFLEKWSLQWLHTNVDQVSARLTKPRFQRVSHCEQKHLITTRHAVFCTYKHYSNTSVDSSWMVLYNLFKVQVYLIHVALLKARRLCIKVLKGSYTPNWQQRTNCDTDWLPKSGTVHSVKTIAGDQQVHRCCACALINPSPQIYKCC